MISTMNRMEISFVIIIEDKHIIILYGDDRLNRKHNKLRHTSKYLYVYALINSILFWHKQQSGIKDVFLPYVRIFVRALSCTVYVV